MIKTIMTFKEWINKLFSFEDANVSQMKKELSNIKVIRDLTACTYVWNPNQDNHNSPTILLMRRQAIELMAKENAGIVDGYSAVYLHHYRDHYSPYAAYYQIKVYDSAGDWHRLDFMLMMNYTLKTFYLVSNTLAHDIIEHRK